MKLIPSIFLLAIFLYLAVQVDAGMTCGEIAGIALSCPLPFQDDSKAFCCYNNNLYSCCTLPDYVINNTGIITGIVIGAVILLLLITLCCCCCCSCCFLAKRRSRNSGAYVPVVAGSQGAHPVVYPVAGQPAYLMQSPVVHPPPPGFSGSIQQSPPYNPAYIKNP